ncbi:MAG: hypothetical protein HKN49_01065 [Gammaproteobacteria bacterium]|nr:hypothetical protein [Gammaproteobacteria bacterium]
MGSLNKTLSLLFLLTVVVVAGVFASHAARADASEWQQEIEKMKSAERGPFRRLRWFCNDGTVLPPKPYACADHGGGVQHGQYSATTEQIRSAGYPIATLLADLQPADIVAEPDGAALLKAMLLEQFLIGFDDGWIFRKARFYRGAIQYEDEERSGQALLQAMANDDDYLGPDFLVLREAVRLLPHNNAQVSLSDVRGMAAAIANADSGFRGLRGKIHGRPDRNDAQRVRDYARSNGREELLPRYAELAEAIDQAYRTDNLEQLLREASATTAQKSLRKSLRKLARDAARNSEDADRLRITANAMASIRNALAGEPDPATRVALLDASLQFERIGFVAARELQAGSGNIPRRTLLQWLQHNADGLYGTGLITQPEHREIRVTLEQIDDEPLRLKRYRQELGQLGMVSEWAARQLRFHFGHAIDRLDDIEPLAEQYIADRLRGSQMLSFDEIHAALALDAQLASNVRHEIFGQPVVRGLRSLNPGLARGTLYIADHDTPMSSFDAHGIYIVPETLPKLPPVAGILTLSEGNALSHVQLLARNLGIPNIVLSEQALETLQPYVGRRVVIAASSGGVIRIAGDSFEWDNVFRAGADSERAPLRVPTDKLDLDRDKLYSLKKLRAKHSGRVVGPKAAKLGELMHQFPGQVAPGLAIPFGVYRELLSQPVGDDSRLSMFEWLKFRYGVLEKLQQQDAAAYEQELERTLEFTREWFMRTPLPDGFEKRLRRAMAREFGREGTYGVFVRSDTNVEDLPDFSGAGLNLTVHNVVGFDATLNAIRRVWASPFTKRAFAWRQSLMDHPEHVYASVLLQQGVPAEKSGVLVTQDVDSGNRDVVTVVVNEGVGGGVDGQLAEMLKISLADGVARRVSSATATERRILLDTGGSRLVPVSGRDYVLNKDEIRALRKLARVVPRRVPEFARGDKPPAADIEFGFHDGKLWLFQIRPLVESDGANRSRYLDALDAGLRRTASRLVDLDRPIEVAQS